MPDDPTPPVRHGPPGPVDVFDALGRPVRVHDRPGSTTYTVYDADGRLLPPAPPDPTGADDPFVVED